MEPGDGDKEREAALQRRVYERGQANLVRQQRNVDRVPDRSPAQCMSRLAHHRFFSRLNDLDWRLMVRHVPTRFVQTQLTACFCLQLQTGAPRTVTVMMIVTVRTQPEPTGI